MNKLILFCLGALFVAACSSQDTANRSPIPPSIDPAITSLTAATWTPLPIPTSTTVPLTAPQISASQTRALPSPVTPVTVHAALPVVEYFGADRMSSSTMIGGSVYVSWRVMGVQSVSVQIINPDESVAAIYDNEASTDGLIYPLGDYLKQFGLPADITFRLILPGYGELDHFVWHVVAPITDAAQALSFTAQPSSVHPGDTVTLTWEVRGADRIAIAAADPSNLPFQNFLDLPPSGSATVIIPLDIRPSTGYPAAVSFGMWVTQPADGRMLLGSSSTYVLVTPAE